MFTGLEAVVKIWPLAAFIGLGLIGYGEIRADIKNLQQVQTQQYNSIETNINLLKEEIRDINRGDKR